MALNNAASHHSVDPKKNIPIDFARTLSFNNDESFKLIITLIANEFEAKKEIFKNFITEREFLSSRELKVFIANIKPYIVCWRIRPQHLGWLDEYLKSLLVGHWRSLSKEPKSMQLTEEKSQDSGPIPVDKEVNSTPIETNSNPQYEALSHSKVETSPFHSRVGFMLDQVNFRLIWTDLNSKKTCYLEIPATLCLVDARAISTQAQSYSWELFIDTFQNLMKDENCDSFELEKGLITYAHPENTMRAIKNQIQFSVALNHIICNLQGCVGKFFYCGSKELKDSMKDKNHTNIVHHPATHSGGNKFPLKPSSSSHISMLRRKTLKARRLKAVSGNPLYSRSGLRTVSKAKIRSIYSSQKVGRPCY